jgi:hypothetical protein
LLRMIVSSPFLSLLATLSTDMLTQSRCDSLLSFL